MMGRIVVMAVLEFPNGIFNRSAKGFGRQRDLKKKKTHPEALNVKFV